MDDDDKVFDEFQQFCDEVAVAATAWQLRWPDACKKCYGNGGASYIEMHGFKHGAGEQMFDTCFCIESGNCPRCSQHTFDEEQDQDIPCSNCGWNWCKGSDDACPEV